MLQAIVTHNNVLTFYITLNIYKIAAYCQLWMKSVENQWLPYCVVGVSIMQTASVSAYTCGLLVLWLALSIGNCRFTCQTVQCGCGVMFGAPTVAHCIAGDVLNVL